MPSDRYAPEPLRSAKSSTSSIDESSLSLSLSQTSQDEIPTSTTSSSGRRRVLPYDLKSLDLEDLLDNAGQQQHQAAPQTPSELNEDEEFQDYGYGTSSARSISRLDSIKDGKIFPYFGCVQCSTD